MTMFAWTAGLLAVAGLLLVLVVLRRRLAVVVVSGLSMEPTFHAGDRLLVRRMRLARISVGDVVVFETPDWLGIGEPPPPERRWMVKRVVALPGDPVPESVQAVVPERRVAPDRLVVLGDNPSASFDSRQCGLIDAGTLLGVAHRRIS
ncbi:signal peptidase I [Nonomuraea basaltis]|uniref:signal peptidase I n=1 Tax=Nonomuraea basaltis TaxID=2495887 RepID=UPI001981C9AF|nr:signal peptidase I [Nonomuraea basaltis]